MNAYGGLSRGEISRREEVERTDTKRRRGLKHTVYIHTKTAK
jgi:hypothetical protein